MNTEHIEQCIKDMTCGGWVRSSHAVLADAELRRLKMKFAEMQRMLDEADTILSVINPNCEWRKEYKELTK